MNIREILEQFKKKTIDEVRNWDLVKKENPTISPDTSLNKVESEIQAILDEKDKEILELKKEKNDSAMWSEFYHNSLKHGEELEKEIAELKKQTLPELSKRIDRSLRNSVDITLYNELQKILAESQIQNVILKKEVEVLKDDIHNKEELLKTSKFIVDKATYYSEKIIELQSKLDKYEKENKISNTALFNACKEIKEKGSDHTVVCIRNQFWNTAQEEIIEALQVEEKPDESVEAPAMEPTTRGYDNK